MKTSDFYYDLPQELIAQHGTIERDASRLLVLDRQSNALEDKVFSDITSYLRAGDCLVLNRTRVMPARLLGRRVGDGDLGGKIEFLLLKRLCGDDWEVLVKPGRRAKPGVMFAFGESLRAEVLRATDDGGRIVRFFYRGLWENVLDEAGVVPLPPYITAPIEDAERYQTVYAREMGSAAAPTAGLHFTNQLLADLEEKGVRIAQILLHVGVGTFRPVKAGEIDEHVMHSEHYEVSKDAADTINASRAAGGRIVCVGTTSCRTLETLADESGAIRDGAGDTDIFIKPGYKFKAMDALITNFHLPESTLLMLVSAFAGRERVLSAYEHAVLQRYRFFSFGDAMLIV